MEWAKATRLEFSVMFPINGVEGVDLVVSHGGHEGGKCGKTCCLGVVKVSD